MKVLIIQHYLNFNLHKRNPTNVFPKLLIKAITDAGMTYEVCSFTKKEILASIGRGCKFILNFEEASTQNAIKFMGGSTKAADEMSMSAGSKNAIDKMFETLFDIEKLVPIYPPVAVLQLTKSKTYLDVLPNKTTLFMPSTKTFLYYKTTVADLFQHTLGYFKRKKISEIIIKFGYSGDSEHVFKYSIDPDITDHAKAELFEAMSHYSHKCGRPFLVIVQPFNSVISNRLNEYRCLFTGGVMSPVAAFGFSLSPTNNRIFIPSLELDPENIEHAEIIALAKYGYEKMSKYVGFNLPVLRVDVSWVIHEGVKRYYINEFEGLSGTYYFNIPYLPKDSGPYRITDIYECTPATCKNYPIEVPRRLARSLVDYIKLALD